MAKTYVQEGNHLDVVAPAGGVVSGTAYVIGDIFGVALTTAAAGEWFVLDVEGVHQLPKTSGDVMAQLVRVYWDNTAKRVTVTATSNRAIGVAAKAAGAGVTQAEIRLNAVALP